MRASEDASEGCRRYMQSAWITDAGTDADYTVISDGAYKECRQLEGAGNATRVEGANLTGTQYM